MIPIQLQTKKFKLFDAIRQFNPRLFVVLALIAGISVFLYKSAFTWLFQIWWNDKDYSHGFLVIPICFYFVYIMRDRIPTLSPKPRTVVGGLVILGAGSMLLAGRAGGVTMGEAVSFLILVPGVILFVWGWESLKAFALPVSYLQFMVPWMEEFTSRIHGPFQLLSAHIGVWIMKAIGLVVYHEGKYIMLPQITLEVARECSGVRYLTSILALGIPLVYLTQRTLWRATGVIASGMVITLLTNGARVAIVGYLTHQYGVRLSHGPVHVFQGWFAAQIGFIALFLVNWRVGKIPSGSAIKLCDRWNLIVRRSSDGDRDFTTVFRRLLAVMLFLAGIAVYLHFYGTPLSLPTRQPLVGFPFRMADWSGRYSHWIQGEIFFPGADAEIVRTYKNPKGREVHLYIAYFGVQRHGKSLISYRSNPLREKARETSLSLSPPAPKVTNQSFPTLGGTRYSSLFWYRFPSGETTGRLRTKLKGVTDSLFKHKNGGAFIMVATPVIENRYVKGEIPEDLVVFIRDLSPVLRDYLP